MNKTESKSLKETVDLGMDQQAAEEFVKGGQTPTKAKLDKIERRLTVYLPSQVYEDVRTECFYARRKMGEVARELLARWSSRKKVARQNSTHVNSQDTEKQ